MTVQKEITEFIKKEKEKGTPFSKVKTALEVVYDKTTKEGSAILAELKYPKRVSKSGITDRMYKFLLENPNCSEEQFKEWIVENGTPNTKRWEKAHQKVRVLVNSLYESLTEDTE